MAGAELEVGKQWAEQRFTEIAAELGAVGGVAPGDRWQKLGKRFKSRAHRMIYYVELGGHVKRGEIVFRDVDLEDAAAGEKGAQESYRATDPRLVGITASERKESIAGRQEFFLLTLLSL